MAETHEGYLTFLNGEAAAMPPYRRVKIHSTVTQVVYADASDGDSWIGVSMPMEGGNPANGEPVTVRLRCEGWSLKMETNEAVETGDPLYPENDGKVSDTAGTVVIGTALSTTTASGGICEVLPNGGSGSTPDEEAIADADGTTGAGIPIILRVSGVTASGTTKIPQPGRNMRIVDAWVIQLGTTATSVTLLNGSTTFTDAVAAGTAAGKRTFFTTFTAAKLTVTASATLYVNLTTADATGVEVVVLALPTAAA